jgi:MFS transporter, FHS family, glucose/mannose:H+ symporter
MTGKNAMSNAKTRLSIFINVFLFAILSDSVGTIILNSQGYFGISTSSAVTFEVFKDLGLAVILFVIVSFITRIYYKMAMPVSVAVISIVYFDAAPGYDNSRMFFVFRRNRNKVSGFKSFE